MKKPAKKKAAKKKAKKKKPTKTAQRAASATKATRARLSPVRTPVTYRADGLRTGSKEAKMLDLVVERPMTEEAICAELGWQKCRVTLKRVCDKVSATLETTKEEGTGKTLYKATLPERLTPPVGAPIPSEASLTP